MNQALAKYAKALCDSLFVSEWDGFDIDWEPGAGFSDSDGTLNNTTIQVLVKEMGKYIGPKSDPEGKGHKLLCIDGYINYFSEEMEEYVDYWITQSYGHGTPDYTSPGNIPEKLIITENFESFATSGGKLLQQAAWMPAEGIKEELVPIVLTMTMTIPPIINGCVRQFKSINRYSTNGKPIKGKNNTNHEILKI